MKIFGLTIFSLLLCAGQVFAATQAESQAAADYAQFVKSVAVYEKGSAETRQTEALDQRGDASGQRPSCTDPYYLSEGDTWFDAGEYEYTRSLLDYGSGDSYLDLGNSRYTDGVAAHNAGEYSQAITYFDAAKVYYDAAYNEFQGALYHADQSFGNFYEAYNAYLIGSGGGGDPMAP